MRTVYRLANTRRTCYRAGMDEGRKRVIGIMAAILTSLHMDTADDLFGTPQGSPRTDKLIAASVQWAVLIMKKIDAVCGRSE
jgi:hypothetical protein